MRRPPDNYELRTEFFRASPSIGYTICKLNHSSYDWRVDDKFLKLRRFTEKEKGYVFVVWNPKKQCVEDVVNSARSSLPFTSNQYLYPTKIRLKRMGLFSGYDEPVRVYRVITRKVEKTGITYIFSENDPDTLLIEGTVQIKSPSKFIAFQEVFFGYEHFHCWGKDCQDDYDKEARHRTETIQESLDYELERMLLENSQHLLDTNKIDGGDPLLKKIRSILEDSGIAVENLSIYHQIPFGLEEALETIQKDKEANMLLIQKRVREAMHKLQTALPDTKVVRIEALVDALAKRGFDTQDIVRIVRSVEGKPMFYTH